MSLFSSRRTTMVDTQVRPSDVTNLALIAAMLAVPREEFVPLERREAAYAGANLHLSGTRVMLDPRSLAKMIDLLAPQTRERALIIGGGTGYSAAVLVAMGIGHVVLIEDESALAETAATQLGGHPVEVVTSPLSAGAAGAGPFDMILIEGAIEVLPEALAAQLRDGGRITAIFREGNLANCRIGHKSGEQIAWRTAFPASAPVLVGFEKPSAFAL